MVKSLFSILNNFVHLYSRIGDQHQVSNMLGRCQHRIRGPKSCRFRPRMRWRRVQRMFWFWLPWFSSNQNAWNSSLRSSSWIRRRSSCFLQRYWRKFISQIEQCTLNSHPNVNIISQNKFREVWFGPKMIFWLCNIVQNCNFSISKV